MTLLQQPHSLPKPKEVLVVVDESGNVIQEPYKDTESINLYETMKHTLIYLSILDSNNMTKVMLDKLNQISSGMFAGFDQLNRLCWAIGAIHESMAPEAERYYLIQVIKELLSLCERKRGKDNKAIVAANIMYVVGQYPGFLRSQWKFLKTVVKKLNEFMHEKHPGVQDMACETYIAIAKECKEEFSKSHKDEGPYLDTILNTLQNEIRDLEPHQKQMVYESVGWMIRAVPIPAEKEVFLLRLMDAENSQWESLLASINTMGIDYLKNPLTIKQIDSFIRINEAVASSVGECYSVYLQKIYRKISLFWDQKNFNTEETIMSLEYQFQYRQLTNI